MNRIVKYEDKLAYITDFATKLSDKQQQELFEEASSNNSISKQVDYLYERIITGKTRMEL